MTTRKLHISKARGEWRLYSLRRKGERGRGVIARGTFEEVCSTAWNLWWAAVLQ